MVEIECGCCRALVVTSGVLVGRTRSLAFLFLNPSPPPTRTHTHARADGRITGRIDQVNQWLLLGRYSMGASGSGASAANAQKYSAIESFARTLSRVNTTRTLGSVAEGERGWGGGASEMGIQREGGASFLLVAAIGYTVGLRNPLIWFRSRRVQ